MKKTLTLAISLVLLGSVLSPNAFASVKPGSKCSFQGQTKNFQGKKYTCIKSGKKFIWGKGFSIAKNAPSPTPTQTPVPTPNWFSNVKEITPKAVFSYLSFQNNVIQLYPWEGEKVAVLTVRADLDPLIMGKIIAALDLSYSTYNELTNFTPLPRNTYNGKILIAEIPSNLPMCGAACGYLGETGIQIYDTYFQKLYEGVKNKNQFDQVLFYELGRNFWNYSSWTSKLAFKENDSVVTGFAVLMRFVTMAANDIPLSDFNSYTGVEFLETVENLTKVYLSTPNFTFSNTFAIQKSPGALGTTDLWASIMMDFAKRYGEKNFYREFFKSIQTLPHANTTLEAVKNWETALSKATKTDVSGEFINTWKMYK